MPNDPKTPQEDPIVPVETTDVVVTPEATPDPIEPAEQVVPIAPDPDAIVSPDIEPPLAPAIEPGTGIDEDGDADKIATPNDDLSDVHVDSEDDYEDMVKLSSVMGDVMDKDEAEDYIIGSQLSEHYKELIIAQIVAGEITTPQYKETLLRIKSATDNGAIYRPGSDGL